jgi:hypothetical protein
MTRPLIVLAVSLSVGLSVGLAAAPAHAEDLRSVKKIEDMNRAAMEDYDLLEFDAAKKQLGDALALAKRTKLDRHAVAAKTHLHLGIVYGAGSGDQDTALLEFIAALQIDPTAKLDAAYRSPALSKTFDQARATVGGARGTGPAPPVVSPPSEERGLKHTPVEEAPGGQAILISARIGGDLKPAQIVLAYRAAGASGFTTSAMKSANGIEYQGVIPDTATRGSSVHYYIEARSATGKILAASGNVDAPNIVSITHPAVVRAGGDEGPDEENPLGRKTANAEPEGEEPTTVAKPSRPRGRTFWVGFSIGSGAGYINGETEVSHQEVTCCLAPAPFHVQPEIGLYLSPQLTISAYGRIGFPLGANVEGAATLAPAVLARLAYIFGRGFDSGGIFLHFDLGGGFIRHIIKLTKTSATAAMGDTDTFATGPLFVGGGFGYQRPIAGPVRLQIDFNVLLGVPIIKEVGSGARPTRLGFAVNGDVTLGLAVGF